ncbi:IlvD/Edd family dehydratase [Staphylococcus saprophyticus]
MGVGDISREGGGGGGIGLINEGDEIRIDLRNGRLDVNV